MSALDAESIYALLPAWIRERDVERGDGVLRALIGVVASQAQVLDANLDQLYDDAFVETCVPWVLPYIGDLIGFRPLRPVGVGQPSATRAEVANTIGYRRRKGTLSVLEQLATDVTGWPSIAVEFFTRLATTQYVRNHLRPLNAIVDVRSPMTAEDVGSAFDIVPRSADVRRIASGRGRYNIPNIGVFVWRLRAYGGATLRDAATPTKFERSEALRVGPNHYTFDPYGDDVSLVFPPQPRATFALAARTSVPFALRRLRPYLELEAWRAAIAAGTTFTPSLFAPPSPFVVFDVDGSAIALSRVEICDLSSWNARVKTGIRVAVDPLLGRFTFPKNPPSASDRLRVTYAYAFSGDYGGGTYVRHARPGEATLAIVISDFATADLATVAGEVVELGAADLHHGDIILTPDARPLTIRAADLGRPVLDGNLLIHAAAGGSVTLRGLGIRGTITIARAPGAAPGPFTLHLEHCTVRKPLSWTIDAGGTLTVDRSLCGPLVVHPSVDVTINDSTVDAGGDASAAISADGTLPCGSLTVARSTIFGSVAVRELPLVENTIITGPTVAARRQAGCVRYTYLPRASMVPPRYRVQPDATIDAAIEEARHTNPLLSKGDADAIAVAIERWLVPMFTSRRRGSAGYAQLADKAPDPIRFGAEDGDEMGVFFSLYCPRREANLRFRLEEYLRAGLESGIVHAT